MSNQLHDKSLLEDLDKRLQQLEKEAIKKQAELSQVSQDLEGLNKEVEQKTKASVNKLKRRHKFLYVLIAFLGVNLIWYSFWTLISEIPVVNNPYVAGVLGIIILLAFSKFYDNLVW